MNKHNTLFIFLFMLFLPFLSCTSDSEIQGGGEPYDINAPDYRNFYGIVWTGSAEENLAYAKQMEYDYVFYRAGMRTNANANNLKFYIESPEYLCYLNRIDRKKTYTQEEIDSLSHFIALKDASAPFPDNLATGWFFSDDTYTILPDLQQQRVIDILVTKILNMAARYENKENAFNFGGFAWDVPQLTGDFWDRVQTEDGKTTGRQITLKHWTGSDSGDKHPDVTHEYATYSDARAAFYKTLWKKTREKYPDARFIVEPWTPYDSYYKQIKDRADVAELIPDIMVQERPNTEFATDERITNSGWFTHSQLGCTTPNIFTEEKNRKIAGLAASKGSIFGWFGRFGGTGDMPAFKTIKDVPARLQLVRAIPNWENLHRTPIEERVWDGEVYSSPKAYISADVIYAVQPRTDRLFVVFLTPEASVTIPESHTTAKVYPTDQMFCESDSPVSDIRIDGNSISLASPQGVGVGYILKNDKN